MLVDPSSRPEVLAILPTLGSNLNTLQACVSALKNTKFQKTLSILIIVNNPEIVLEPIEGVSLVYPGMNLGFNGGLVFGSQIYDSNFVWIIQDDVFVNSETLSLLIEDLSTYPKISMVSPRRIDAHGNSVGACGGWTDEMGQVLGLYTEPRDTNQFNNDPSKLSWVTGSGSLIRREMWDALQGYDLDLYPLGFGDVDFCNRAKVQGFEFSVSRLATIEHNQTLSSTPLFLKHFLILNSASIFAEKKQDLWKESNILPTVDFQIISKIAQSASIILPKLTKLADAHILELQEKIMNLEKELVLNNSELVAIRQSLVWRFTIPYRLIREKLRHIFSKLSR